MTRNQIEYYKALTGRLEYEENKRHNVVGEIETQRHNVAGEGETQRHNVISEELGFRSQSEIERHNLVVENQSAQSIDVARQQAAASAMSAQASMAAAAASARNAEAAMLNAQTNAALLPYSQASEQAKADMYSAQQAKYTQEAIGTRIENNYMGQVTRAEIGRTNAQASVYDSQAYYNYMAANNLDKINDINQEKNDITREGNWLNFTSDMMGNVNDFANTGIRADQTYSGNVLWPKP